MGAKQKRNTLPLREAGIPRRLQRVAILPIEVVVPNPATMLVLLKVCSQPVGGLQSFLQTGSVRCLAEKIKVREPPLRDRNRVILQADCAAIVEHGYSGRIVGARVVGLLAKRHV